MLIIDAQGFRREVDRLRLPALFDGTSTAASSQEAFEAHDASGGEVITSSPVTVIFDVEDVNTDVAIFSMTSGVLTTQVSGIVDIDVNVTCGPLTSASFEMVTYLERNTGAGWSEVSGTRAYFGEQV